MSIWFRPIIGFIILFFIFLTFELVPLFEWFVSAKWAALCKVYASGIIMAIGISFCLGWGLYQAPKSVLEHLNRFAKGIYIGVLVFFCFAIITMALSKYYALHMYADMANNLEILWRLTHGLGLTSPMFAESHKGLHWFAVHFAPIAYLIAYPWFKLLALPHTLIVLETLSLASASVPIALYAKDRLGSPTGYWLGAVYLLYPTIHFIGLYDFGFLQFCISFLAWLFYSFHKRWLKLYFLFLVLALICREEVGFTVFMFGLYQTLVRREYVLGIITSIIGIGYTFVAYEFIIPSFRTDQGYFSIRHFAAFGQTPGEILITFFTRPLYTIQYFLAPTRVGNFIMFFLPLAFVPLLKPSVLFVVLINFGYAFLSATDSVYSYFLYYLSPSIAFFFFAAIEGILKIKKYLDIQIVAICIFSCGLICQICFGPSPISRTFWDSQYKLGHFYTTNFYRSTYQITDHSQRVFDMVDKIPKDAIVATEQPFLPLVFDRREAHFYPGSQFGQPPKDKIEYVLIDKNYPKKTGFLQTWGDFRERPEFYYAMLTPSNGWEMIESHDGIELYRRLKTSH